MEVYEKAAQLIRSCKPAVVLTGAGISTESGIPDFRSPGAAYGRDGSMRSVNGDL